MGKMSVEKTTAIIKRPFILRASCFIKIFFLAQAVLVFQPQAAFAAIPIQEKSLSGAAAARARLQLLAAAESCLGTPYRYGGIDRKGLDCSGLVYLSFREALKQTVPRTSAAIFAWAEKIAASELQIGDLVFFATTGAGVSHLGIYAGGGSFIHSASEGPRIGVIYSSLDEAYWKRAFVGAGRALPWDEAAALAMAETLNSMQAGDGTGGDPALLSGVSGGAVGAGSAWDDTGFFAGFAAAWTWGGLFDGSPSAFRGFSTIATLGYKWAKYRAALELRPELDRALGVFRLPFTLSAGTDIVQVFFGPALTFGDPSLDLKGGERHYSGGGKWFGELGVSGAIPPIKIGRGALSFYGELAWQPYHWADGEEFSFKPDLSANFRLSTGIRYLWLLGR